MVEVTKGTDIATPALLARLHQVASFEDVGIHHGCRGEARECPQSFTFDGTITELRYGASQVERLRWVLPQEGKRN
jgi:hypothetical protein